jgi:hypothetical protein
MIKSETMRRQMNDVDKCAGDCLSTTAPIGGKLNMETTSTIINENRADIQQRDASKKMRTSKEIKEKTKRKSSLFSNLFGNHERNIAVPAFDLPSIDLDLASNQTLRAVDRHDSDPLRVPSNQLPALNVPLPTYDRPEVDMTSGRTGMSSEFTVPTVHLPDIPNLLLPTVDTTSVHVDDDPLKVPRVQLPHVELTSNAQTMVSSTSRVHPKLPREKQLSDTSSMSTVEVGLALASPVDDLLSIQTDHRNFPIETDYVARIDTVRCRRSSLFHTE